jgi:FAD/FMN-containing dehydrogenase/Fe-S oxidoreductase
MPPEAARAKVHRRGRRFAGQPALRPVDVDVRRLARALRREIRGDVRFDDGSRALWSTDASNYHQVPLGVVLPRDVEDIVATVETARRFGAPVLPRGGGTSLAGQCCNAAVVIDTTKYVNRVLEVDPRRRRARVEPGTILDDLRTAASRHGLTFGPDPATHNHCTLGGMIGNNSCGIHAIMAEFYGPGPTTAHQVEALDVLTYRGARLHLERRVSDEALARMEGDRDPAAAIQRALAALRDRHADLIRRRFPDIPRRVSGYNLPALLPEHGFDIARALVGSEGTCATVLGATVTLIDAPRERALLVAGYEDIGAAGDRIPAIRRLKPIGLEGIDHELVDYIARKISDKHSSHARYLRLLPGGRAFLFIEFAGETTDAAAARAQECLALLRREGGLADGRVHTNLSDQEHLWKVRESGLGATAFVPGEPDTWPGWEDSAVGPDKVGAYLRDLRALFDRYGYRASIYGHLGQGCIHCRIPFDLTSARGVDEYRRFTQEAADLVVGRYGGSLSGEHGDGQARGDLLGTMFGPEMLDVFREFKRVWDPDNKMNPGKVVDPFPRTSNLRLGADYRPWIPQTHFQFPDDHGSFAHATLRCVGVGKCRRTGGGTMCPSYMVLHEEKHTTRGRAHLLFEMLRGESITEGWRSEPVREALDLCLACKGCKGDCPVNVDIATYKAEFLSHYYDGRLRPRHAYAFGLIQRWARLAALAPRLVNLAARTPGLASLAKALAGMAQERAIPAFAPETFQHWFARRWAATDGRPSVILWPDTFNNHFHPEVARAAVEVLEAAGYHVKVPLARLCCGRPLYDYGMLDEARRLLRRTLDVLRPDIEAGVPVVGLEPSCVSVFRDEMRSLLPHDQDAQRLAGQTLLLGDFLARHAADTLPRDGGRALVHLHCHHRSILGTDGEHAVLDRLGLDYTIPEDGCCGMAGSFGFEAAKYDLSMRIGERKLLPAVRAADGGTALVADGFSCRTQIEQATGRRVLHLAELIQQGLRRERGEPTAEPTTAAALPRAAVPVAALIAVGLAGALWWSRRSSPADRLPRR